MGCLQLPRALRTSKDERGRLFPRWQQPFKQGELALTLLLLPLPPLSQQIPQGSDPLTEAWAAQEGFSLLIPLPPHFISWGVYQPPVHWPGSSTVTATLGPRNPDSPTKSCPPASFLHAGASPETALPSSLRQNGSRPMVSPQQGETSGSALAFHA